MNRSIFEPRQWLSVDAPLKNGPGNRSPELLRAVARQFEVERNPRYARSVGATWCNIFLWDVTAALRCEIPHWIEVGRILHDSSVDMTHEGDPAPLPDKGAAYEPTAPRIKSIELTANGVVDWLAKHGPRFGWSVVERVHAGELAALGQPVAVVWANKDRAGRPAGPGHVALLLPPVDGALRIVQAGGRNFYDKSLEAGFANLPVLFYAHA